MSDRSDALNELAAMGQEFDAVIEQEDHALLRAAVEKALGLLWRYAGSDKTVHEARLNLLTQLGSEGKKRGVDYAMAKHGPLLTVSR